MNDSPNQTTDQVIDDARRLVSDVRDNKVLESIYQENPYLVIGVAAGIGYVAAGGLATPFTRRLLRVGMKALFVPLAATQLKEIAVGVGAAQSNQETNMEK